MKKTIYIIIILFFNVLMFNAQTSEKYLIKNLDINNQFNNQGISLFNIDFVVFSSQSPKKLKDHTRKKKRKKKKKEKKVKNEKNLTPDNIDFYFGSIGENGNIINAQKIGNEVNSEFNENGVCFSSNNETVYFSREIFIRNSEQKHFELFKAEVVSPGSWVNVKKLPFNDEKSSIMYPFLTNDGKYLYYSSNKTGRFNIYKVKILSEWGFGNPEKLSNAINGSTSDEISPFIFENTLYFSSDKIGSLGGFDIYSINLQNSKAIAKQLEEPLNSNAHDFCYVKKNESEGYFNSNRANGEGKEDIYYFKQLIKDEEEVTTNKKIIVTKETLVKNESAYDFQRRTSYDKRVETTEIDIDENRYTNESNVKDNDEFSKCQMEFDKIDDIHFDFNKSYIREDAAIELNKVIRVLRLCPKITLLASSHTDCRASNVYNLELSQQRSSSVVRYLLQNGSFSPDRIKAIGYGEERLANRCSDGVPCTEKEHEINRRTHFEIFNY